MSYQNTRTARFENHLEAIKRKRAQVEPYRTAARHYEDLADDILTKIKPLKNADGQGIADVIVRSCLRRAEKFREHAAEALAAAEAMEKDGLNEEA